MDYYNSVRLHSAIGYLAPKDKLEGRDREIFAARDRKLAEARQRRQQARQAERRQCQADGTQCHASVTARPAIDFAAVRAAVTMTAVLGLLGFAPKSRRGGQQRGPCPLHGSTHRTSRCFSAHVDKNVFHCFKCGRSGNALDLWAAATGQAPYDAAVDLCQRLAIPLPMLHHDPKRNRDEKL